MNNLLLASFLLLFWSCNNGNASNPWDASEPKHLPKERKQVTFSDSLRKVITYDDTLLAITNVRLIDGLGNPPKADQTLIIRNGYFTKVGPDGEIQIPQSATIIDAAGKTVIPGIVGVHNHLHMPGEPFMGEEATRLYLASGVTTIQTCGSASPYKDIALAEQIEKGVAPGPDIVTSGPYFTGPGGNPNMIIPRDAAHIRDTMKHWIGRGVRWFKVYRHTRPEDLKVIIEEAHRNGAKVTGHLCSVTFREAVEMGIDGIEHGLNSTSDFRRNKTYGECNGSRGYIDSLEINNKKVRRLHQMMIDKGVFLTSTLSIYESSIPGRAAADDRSLKMMSPRLISEYHDRMESHTKSREEGAIREERLKRIMAFEYQFAQMGGILTAGVDAGRHNLPGFGDQRNFELLCEAGFSPEEAIRIMTANGARVLSRDEIGSIQEGKRADFVLLNGDLSQDPAVIQQVETVFKAGYGYDPETLIRGLEGTVGPG